MDRTQFMKELEKLLCDISEGERQEALAYYNSYFDEAGPEMEASVIREKWQRLSRQTLRRATMPMRSIRKMDMRICGKMQNLLFQRGLLENENLPMQGTVITQRKKGQTADLFCS